MNLRYIKKKISYELGAFIEDCSMVATLSAKTSEKEIEKLMTEAINLHDELRDKVNMVEGDPKAYYQKLHKEVEERTDALYDKLSAAVKAVK